MTHGHLNIDVIDTPSSAHLHEFTQFLPVSSRLPRYARGRVRVEAGINKGGHRVGQLEFVATKEGCAAANNAAKP
jgi:hypothetical protein